MAQGDLTQAFHTTQRDEIGALVQEVDTMRLRHRRCCRSAHGRGQHQHRQRRDRQRQIQDLSARTEQTASQQPQTTAQSMEEPPPRCASRSMRLPG